MSVYLLSNSIKLNMHISFPIQDFSHDTFKMVNRSYTCPLGMRGGILFLEKNKQTKKPPTLTIFLAFELTHFPFHVHVRNSLFLPFSLPPFTFAFFLSIGFIFKSNFRFTAILQRGYRDSPILSASMHAQPPPLPASPTRAATFSLCFKIHLA